MQNRSVVFRDQVWEESDYKWLAQGFSGYFHTCAKTHGTY